MEEVSPENLAELEKRYRTTVTIFAAQILSSIVLILVALFLTPKNDFGAR